MNKKNLKKILLCITAGMGILFIALKLAAKLTEKDRFFDNEESEKNPNEGKRVVFVGDENEDENADGVRGHLEAIADSEYNPGFYERFLKRVLDVILSFGGILVLAPFFAGIALAIKADDPGPVLFTQKRLGQNKKYFKLYKFRSMKMSTPHDTPTHMLENPEQYITKVGKFLRAHSLDELPQLFNVFSGEISLVGPRPGLWNQDLLTAERDKYGVNELKPGITGWAQINGRDSISIQDKAVLDGYYKEHISLLMDLKCLFRTIYKVGYDETVVEGGTGTIGKEKTESKAAEWKGTEPAKTKKVLIAGKDSYIGESLKAYLTSNPEYYQVDIIDTKGLKLDTDTFRGYDVVVNAAGVAHVKETEDNRSLYYEVNRDLCIEMAECARKAGTGQFIALSSMSVYGLTEGHIMKYMEAKPDSAYGDSKYQADKALFKLENEKFKVAVLRPPMVYGKGCKGNYQTLRKFSLKSPVFPKISNERSMLYIGNLCEFIKNTIDEERRGLFLPQNSEYVTTYEMVKLVAEFNGKKICIVPGFKRLIKLFDFNIIKKVFGKLTYEKTDCVGKFDFRESIRLSEE